MSDQVRARKLADRIKEIAAGTLERQVKDPRLGLVTITDVRITADLHDATLFYTVLGDEAEQEATARALASATGLVRAEVGKGTGVRFTPTITFVSDAIPQTSKAIEELLEKARAADAELVRVRAGAAPAGDADPYRKPPGADSDGEDGDEAAEPDS
ncbi:MAG: ribosome-binding factor [Frankiales bacterium]|nr:ribosome-binding factor [Frankiales bacterium]MDX6245754.1 ribosome-binding factor [Frankiales bacterium]